MVEEDGSAAGGTQTLNEGDEEPCTSLNLVMKCVSSSPSSVALTASMILRRKEL